MQKSRRTSREQSILMSLWGVLLGNVTPKMRAVFVRDGELLELSFIFDGAFTEEEEEKVQCLGSEVSADFFDSEIDVKCVRCDYPAPLEDSGRCVYKRKEKF